MGDFFSKIKSAFGSGQKLPEAPALDPTQKKAIEDLALVFEKREAWLDAVEKWLEITAIDTKHLKANLGLGVAYQKMGKTEAASMAYKDAIEERGVNTVTPRNCPADHELKVRAQNLQKLHHWREAIKCWTDILIQFPHSLEAGLNIVNCLIEIGEHMEARQVCADLAEKFPTKVGAWQNLARIAEREKNWLLGDLVWAKLFELSGRSQDLLVQYVSYLLKQNKFSAALEVYERDLKALGTFGSGLALYDIYKAAQDVEGALAVLNELEKSGLGDERHLRNLKAETLSIGRRYGEAAILMEDVLVKKQAAPLARNQLAQYYLLDGYADKALDVMETIAEKYGYHRSVSATLSWAYANQGDVAQARAIWDRVPYRPRYQSRKSLSMRVDQLSWPKGVTGEARLRLYTHVKDDKFRLQTFLDYYRALGVQEFFVVDYGSKDGSREFLKKQEDVVVYGTDDDFAESENGAYWTNFLMQDSSYDGWSLNVGIEDFLIFPDMEQVALEAYLDLLEEVGDEVVLATTLDMFPESFGQLTSQSDDLSPLDLCPYFDLDLARYPDFVAPYETSEGGINFRLFDMPLGVSQTKASLVKSGFGIRFLNGTQRLTPAKVSHMRVGLLRFGWLGDMLAQSDALVRQGPKDEGSDERKKIAMHSRILEIGNEESLIGPDTVAYESSDQLEQLGLISRGTFVRD